MNFWQIAAGAAHRDYSQYFLKYGMAFVGGDACRRTISGVQAGDCVVLRRGTKLIVASGTVVERNGRCCGDAEEDSDGSTDWLRDFDGWDLPGYCYVEWHVPSEPVVVNGLVQATINRLYKDDLIQLAGNLLSLPASPVTTAGPARTRELADEDILDFLVAEGLRTAAAEDLTAAFNRIRRLARYYYRNCNWDDVREHETRTFLVMPLLIALGWSEQQIKIGCQSRSKGASTWRASRGRTTGAIATASACLYSKPRDSRSAWIWHTRRERATPPPSRHAPLWWRPTDIVTRPTPAARREIRSATRRQRI